MVKQYFQHPINHKSHKRHKTCGNYSIYLHKMIINLRKQQIDIWWRRKKDNTVIIFCPHLSHGKDLLYVINKCRASEYHHHLFWLPTRDLQWSTSRVDMVNGWATEDFSLSILLLYSEGSATLSQTPVLSTRVSRY